MLEGYALQKHITTSPESHREIIKETTSRPTRRHQMEQIDEIYSTKTYLPHLLSPELLRNIIRKPVHHRIRWMQRIQPEILIHRNSARCVEVVLRRRPIRIRRTIRGGVPVERRLREALRIVQHLIEECVCVEDEGRGVCMRCCQIRSQNLDLRVEVRNVGGFEGTRVGTLRGGQGAAVDGRHVEEKEVPRARSVQLLHQAGVLGEDESVEIDGGVEARIGISYVVDADEDAEECVPRLPGENFAGSVQRQELALHLSFKTEHSRKVWCDESGVYSRAAVG